MKVLRPPLWLVCDLIAFIGELWSLMLLGHAVGAVVKHLAAEGRRKVTPAEHNAMAPLLAQAECWRSYAIWRQAFRLNGLDPARVRWHDFSPPRTPKAFARRLRAFTRNARRLDHLARQLAAKLRRVLSDDACRSDPLRLPSQATISPRLNAVPHLTGLPRLGDVRSGAAVARARAPPALFARGPPARSISRCRPPIASERKLLRSQPFQPRAACNPELPHRAIHL